MRFRACRHVRCEQKKSKENALKVVLTNEEGEGLVSVGQQVRANEQKECSREAGGDFAHAVRRRLPRRQHYFREKDHDP